MNKYQKVDFNINQGTKGGLQYVSQRYNLFTRRRDSKAFYRNPKTTFLAYFHVFAGSHQWAYH